MTLSRTIKLQKNHARMLFNFHSAGVLQEHSDQIGRLNCCWCAQLTVRYCQSLGAVKFSRAGPRPHNGVPEGGRPPSENVEEISASQSVTPQWTSGAKGLQHGSVSPPPPHRLWLILCQSDPSIAAEHETDLSAVARLHLSLLQSPLLFLLCILMKLKGQQVTWRTTVKMWENAARSNVDYLLLWQWVWILQAARLLLFLNKAFFFSLIGEGGWRNTHLKLIFCILPDRVNTGILLSST